MHVHTQDGKIKSHKLPVYVYWMLNNEGISKIGVSNNPDRRLLEVRRCGAIGSSTFVINFVMPFQTYEQAYAHESKVHDILAEYKVTAYRTPKRKTLKFVKSRRRECEYFNASQDEIAGALLYNGKAKTRITAPGTESK